MIKQSMITLLLVCGACAAPEADQLGEVSQNGMSFNGRSLNGTSLNGTTLNGKSLNGKSLNGISFNGTSLTGVAITAASAGGPPLAGDLVGSTWTGTAVDGTVVSLRVDGATQGTAPNSELWFYAMSYQTTTGWSPLCGVDSTGAPIQVVSVAGLWRAMLVDAARYSSSTTQFTLACRATSIAKCVELGYKPYLGYTDQLTSCVRLLRADYCGTGTPHTVDGTTVNLYDSVGVQLDTEIWLAEAEWTPSGARCVNSSNLARYNLVQSTEPTCVQPLQTATCGRDFASGAVLIDELPPDLAPDLNQSSTTTTTTTTTSKSSTKKK